ncbi:RAMP superfamily CRISPR-associated protein [Vibrio metschnikovii]|uniref:RAMP superfamily CRISPR-associated protein n=1 Tax=Vibrio metschnikovii TaxID=28172 RepID=UPI001C3019FF|nr:RAMP superfamily CRISPR-associated protein [Vibrio metschnikovii]
MQWFKIELLGNLILSEKTATAGDHRSLDYIPATAIQGVIASRAYQQMPKAEADQLVLLQGAQISDALPMLGDEVGLPVPLAWHTDKAKIIEDAFIPSKLSKEELAGSQPQQIRSGYVTPSNIHFKPKMERHTKTAIDPNTGTVATGQLFNYQSIARGQCYLFAVESSPELSKKIQSLIEGKAFIGRSRSAEFGSVRITKCPAAPELPKCSKSNTLLLLSDTQ